MKMTNGQARLLAGIDFREVYPCVCYQTETDERAGGSPAGF